MTDHKVIRQAMQAVYERNAAHFDAERNKSGLEFAWLARFAGSLTPGDRVLDAGCGSAEPVSRWLIERGYQVTGVDYAAPMIEIAASRFPNARWRVGDLRTLELNEVFDGVLSWHAFYHLSPAEQRVGLERLCAHLKPGGPLMFTVGPRAGEAIGYVAGDPVYHASFSRAAYEEKLDALGVELEDFVINDAHAGGASVLLARKR